MNPPGGEGGGSRTATMALTGGAAEGPVDADAPAEHDGEDAGLGFRSLQPIPKNGNQEGWPQIS